MKRLICFFFHSIFILRSAIGADFAVPDRGILESMAREYISVRQVEVRCSDLVLRDVVYAYQVNVADRETNEYFNLTFIDPKSLRKSRRGAEDIVSLKIVNVLLISSGVVAVNVMSETVTYRGDGKLVRGRGVTISPDLHLPVMEPFPRCQERLRPMLEKLDRDSIITSASEAVAAQLPFVHVDGLSFERLYYEWRIGRMQATTNEVIWVDFLVPTASGKNIGQDTRPDTAENRRIKVSLDRHGTIVNSPCISTNVQTRGRSEE